MQLLSAIIVIMLSSANIDPNTIDDKFHQRLLLRLGLAAQNVKIETLTNKQVLNSLRAASMHELIAFARQYDLVDAGFSYRHNDLMYSIKHNQKIILYTFSIDIIKENTPAIRCIYEVDFNINGGSYIRRIVKLAY